jgi:predicted nucleic acid-binding protein
VIVVVDASAVLELLLRTSHAERIAERLLNPEVSLHAPHLLDLEVAQVIRRYSRAGELPEDRAGEALDDFRDLRIHRHPHEPLLSRVWEMRHNLTAYDAAYIALAEAIGGPLLTRDVRLASAPGHAATIETI